MEQNLKLIQGNLVRFLASALKDEDILKFAVSRSAVAYEIGVKVKRGDDDCFWYHYRVICLQPEMDFIIAQALQPYYSRIVSG